MQKRNFFSYFGCKVTKKFLYLHQISILIKIKGIELGIKGLYRGYANSEIAKRRLQIKPHY